MSLNAAVFFFCAAQHLGVSFGSFHEPRIIPATIVETTCGLLLVWGTTAVFRQSQSSWHRAVIVNLVVLGLVILGIV